MLGDGCWMLEDGSPMKTKLFQTISNYIKQFEPI